MASYVVMEPPVRDGAEKAILIRDGFHFLAFVFPVFWLLFHRLWLEALGVLAAALALGAASSYLGYDPLAIIASLALGIFIGLEGAALKTHALSRRGWRHWGVVEAETRDDAEIRYLALNEVVAQVEPVLASVAVKPVRGSPAGAVPALGMLGYPGRG